MSKDKNLFQNIFYFFIYGLILGMGIYFKNNIWKIIASLLSITCTLLLTKGKLINFVFGVAYAILYGIICAVEKVYGSMLLSFFVTLTAQILGFINWKKNMSKGSPKIKTMTNKWRIIIAILTIISITILTFVLKLLKSNNSFFDATTTILFILSMSLMIFVYIEEWIVCALANLANIMLWLTMGGSGLENITFLIMAVVGVVVSIIGLINWIKMLKIQLDETKI